MDGCDLPGCDLPDVDGCIPDVPDAHGCVWIAPTLPAGNDYLHPTIMLLVLLTSFMLFLLSYGLPKELVPIVQQTILCIGCIALGGFFVACLLGHNKKRRRKKPPE